jgi:hypothetical protein
MPITGAVEAYSAERKIVDMLADKFALDKKDLYKFLIHRKFGKDIIQKVYGTKTERGVFEHGPEAGNE